MASDAILTTTDIINAGPKKRFHPVLANTECQNYQNTLYQHLDVEVLINYFAHGLHKKFSVSTLDLNLPEIDIEVDLSRQSVDKKDLSYPMQLDLQHQGKSLGQLTVFRDHEFSAFEKVSIDNVAKDLCSPLYNAIRYASACRASYRDALTGLYNRAALEAFFFDNSVSATSTTTAVMICDVDKFKWINDHYGHTTGDEVLAQFSDKLAAIIDNDGSVFRYGGDEFVITLDSMSIARSLLLAENICSETKCCLNQVIDDGFELTTTIGATAVHPDESLRDTFSRADAALLKGKADGSNRVVWYN